jgi:hypothetical protein
LSRFNTKGLGSTQHLLPYHLQKLRSQTGYDDKILVAADNYAEPDSTPQLTRHWNGSRDEVPVFADGTRNHGLDVDRVFPGIGGTDVKAPVVLDGHADEAGDGVLEFPGQVGLLRGCISSRGADAGGSSVGGREGDLAVSKSGVSWARTVAAVNTPTNGKGGGEEGLKSSLFHFHSIRW